MQAHVTMTGLRCSTDFHGRRADAFKKLVAAYESGIPWDEFARLRAETFKDSDVHVPGDVKDPLWKVAQDLELRLGVAQGKVAQPDYRDFIHDSIERSYGSRQAFCDHAGVPRETLNAVLAAPLGRASARGSAATLEVAQSICSKLGLDPSELPGLHDPSRTRSAIEARSGFLLLWRVRFVVGEDGEPPGDDVFAEIDYAAARQDADEARLREEGFWSLYWGERRPPRDDHVAVACEFLRSGKVATEFAWAVALRGVGDLLEILTLAGRARDDIWVVDLAASRGEPLHLGVEEQASRLAFVKILHETKLEDWVYCPRCHGTGVLERKDRMLDWCTRCYKVSRVLKKTLAKDEETPRPKAARRRGRSPS